jgi:hypothetical protein
MTQVQTIIEGKVYKAIPITTPAFEIVGTGSVDLYTSLSNETPTTLNDPKLKTTATYSALTEDDYVFEVVPKFLKFEESAAGSRVINFMGMKLEDLNLS